MTGEWTPINLDLDDPPVARCSRCHRATWTASDVWEEDRMVQPDGSPCGGTFLGMPVPSISGSGS